MKVLLDLSKSFFALTCFLLIIGAFVKLFAKIIPAAKFTVEDGLLCLILIFVMEITWKLKKKKIKQ